MDEVTAPSTTVVDEAALVALLREQPSAGLAALYDCYGRLIFSVALRFIQDPSTAEEITQDVFLRCWRTIDRYQADKGSLRAWLLAITHNRAIDELRRQRGKDQHQESFDDALASVRYDPGLDEALLRDEVRQGLHLLPPNQRDVIALVYWGGLTRREIAEKLQLPLGTVHTRLRLGMEKLREAFGHLFDGT